MPPCFEKLVWSPYVVLELGSGAPMWFWEKALEQLCVGPPPPPCWSAGELPYY